MKPIIVVTLQGGHASEDKRKMASQWAKNLEGYHIIVMDGGQHKSVKILSGRTIKLKKKYIDKYFSL